jgi:hypothetical protein
MNTETERNKTGSHRKIQQELSGDTITNLTSGTPQRALGDPIPSLQEEKKAYPTTYLTN